MTERSRTRPDAACPLRPGDPCTLCQLDVTGPQDCPLVYLVMADEALRDELGALRREHAAAGAPGRVRVGLGDRG